jgi:two-component system phosphate regulon response regulator PhoB
LVDSPTLPPPTQDAYDGAFFEWNHGAPCVLVIDDDDDTRALVSSMLERDRLRVVQAADGESALEVLQGNDISAVILDVVLPGLDGHEVCRALRARQPERRIPVIMLTALQGLDAELLSVATGADAHLTKPVTRTVLLQRLRDLI